MSAVLGVDLGGSKMLTGLVVDGRLVGEPERSRTGRGLGPEALVAAVAARVADLRAGGAVVEALGLGFPGLVNATDGRVLSSVMLDGWADEPLSERLSAAAGCPAWVENDVSCAAIEESAARGPRRGGLLMVSVGTGIGGAVVGEDGRLWRGRVGIAGEFGHLRIALDGPTCFCGAAGCLNALASGTAIEQRAGLPPGSLSEHEPHDPKLDEALRAGADALGAALSHAVHLLDPGCVVLGGGVASLGRVWFDRVERALRDRLIPELAQVPLELAAAGERASLLGAARLAEAGLHGRAT